MEEEEELDQETREHEGEEAAENLTDTHADLVSCEARVSVTGRRHHMSLWCSHWVSA